MKEEILKRVQEHYNYINVSYEVVFIALQGSQNYNLDVYDKEYTSDVDTKAVVLPTFKDFVYNKEPVSKTVVLSNAEHIDVKDIRVMLNTYKKQNINYIETLFTDYVIVNDKYKDLVKPLFENRELIAHMNINQALNCMSGMSKQKLKALQHPYPTIVDKIEKYGYDPKQLHHIIRLNEFIKKYINNTPYKECLETDNRDYLLDIKKGKLPVEEAVKLAQEVDAETYSIKEANIDTEVYLKPELIRREIKAESILDEVKYNILKQYFKEQLIED